MPSVGVSVPRSDGWGKVTGRARYVDDLVFPGMLFGRTVRSRVAAGRVAAVRVENPPPGLVVVDHRDIPGRNVVALIDDDQPSLVVAEVGHAEEAVLLLAHADRELLWSVDVAIDYTPATPLFNPRQSRHAFKHIRIDKGDLAAGFRAADLVVEGQYATGHQEQLYIEPNGVVAVPGDGGLTVYGSLQCPHYVHRALVVLLGWAAERVRVVQVETGGGFGGKEDYPSVIAGHAALLALKAGRPVKLVYDRSEDMAATTKRHPSIVRHRTGVTKDGRLTAMEIDVLLDGGAYTTLSPVVLSRGVLHATGPYRCDHVRIDGRAVRTNTPPNGAFRGFGAPQTLFAAEVHMDRIAEALGICPVTLRERNVWAPGDTTATGQVLGDDCSAREVLAEAVRRTRFREKRARLAGSGRGIGLSLFFHGSGFTGSGEAKLASTAALEVTSTGVRVLVSSTEIGQGTRTMLAQIVAQTLDLPFDAVDVAEVDTDVVPDSGPTVASRTCMIVGRILQRAAEGLRARLGGLSPAEHFARHGRLVVTEAYERPPGVDWDDERFRGAAYGAYGFACDVVEIDVDADTGEVRPTAFTSVHDVGRAIHPAMVRGQIEGGSAQGLGYALLEEVVMSGGRMVNAQLTNYIVPTTLDTPPMDVAVLEYPYAHGPYGAKGVGEMPIDGPAPAVVNALRHAGVDLRSIPATPERVLEAVCASR